VVHLLYFFFYLGADPPVIKNRVGLRQVLSKAILPSGYRRVKKKSQAWVKRRSNATPQSATVGRGPLKTL
jgi:hypothetical protein